MPVLTGQVSDVAGVTTWSEVYRLIIRMRYELHPADCRDALWVIHPETWYTLARNLNSKGEWNFETQRLDQDRTPTVREDLFRPSLLFGLPLHLRSQGVAPGEAQLWVENDMERTLRRNPRASINVVKFEMPDPPPPCPEPTLRAVFGKWVKRARARRRV